MKNLLHKIGFSTGTMLLLALLAPLSVMAADGDQAGCPATSTPAATTTPTAFSATTLIGGRITIEIFCDEFISSDGIVFRVIQLKPGQFFDVVLCSNPSTGFRWSEMADIDDTSIVSQGGHSFLPPPGNLMGAAGKEVWTFQTLRQGQATLSFEYSQPWQGGEKAAWVFDLILVVTPAVTPAATTCPATPAVTTCPTTPAATPAATTCPATPAATPAATACPITPAATACPVTPAATVCPVTPAATTTPAATACPASTVCP